MAKEDILITEDEIIAEASKDRTYCQLAVDIGVWAAETQLNRIMVFIGGVFSESKWEALKKAQRSKDV